MSREASLLIDIIFGAVQVAFWIAIIIFLLKERNETKEKIKKNNVYIDLLNQTKPKKICEILLNKRVLEKGKYKKGDRVNNKNGIFIGFCLSDHKDNVLIASKNTDSD